MAFTIDQQREALLASQARLMSEREAVEARIALASNVTPIITHPFRKGDPFYTCSAERMYEVASQGTEIHAPITYATVRVTTNVRGTRRRVIGTVTHTVPARDFRRTARAATVAVEDSQPTRVMASDARFGTQADYD